MASVTFDHVKKAFGEVIVLEDFNIHIEDKEFLVFVGPSGSGKSTGLRMLAGLEEITDGIIKIEDRIVNNVAPKDRDVAMVFQSYALYPHMTVYDNMAFGLKLRKTPKSIIDERVNEAAKELGIGHLLDRRPRQLSGGQRQRVAVGRAIVRDPKVFLMDEPLSNLDAKLRVEARSFISRLHQRHQTTFIYVTHDQVEAMTMGTRIAVLNGGRLQQIDTPYILYHNPANTFVAGFIGSPSMNFFKARLEDGPEGGLTVKVFSDESSSNVLDFDIPEAQARPFRSHLNRQVTLGIRPEDIHDATFKPSNIVESPLKAEVEVVEQMGNEMILYLHSGEVNFVARTDPRTEARVGATLEMVLNVANVHMFDDETEESLAYDAKQEQLTSEGAALRPNQN